VEAAKTEKGRKSMRQVTLSSWDARRRRKGIGKTKERRREQGWGRVEDEDREENRSMAPEGQAVESDQRKAF
jgi:hypothetical protein